MILHYDKKFEKKPCLLLFPLYLQNLQSKVNIFYVCIMHGTVPSSNTAKDSPGHLSEWIFNERMNEYILQDNITPICLSLFGLL